MGVGEDDLVRVVRPAEVGDQLVERIDRRSPRVAGAHQAGGGTIEEGMVLALEPGCYWEEGGGLRLEDNFLITAGGAEKLSSFPDGIVQA